MPELTTADVELFTGGRLLANDIETARVLARAYAAVRNYCGWHVTPSRVDTVTLDGPGNRLLSLPTLQLITLTTVIEDGVTLNISDLRWSTRQGTVRKKSGARWSGFFNSIVVTMTHGYATAPDFDQAVLEAVDQVSLKVGTGGTGGVKRRKIDDTETEWMTGGVVYESGLNESLLQQYRIIPPA